MPALADGLPYPAYWAVSLLWLELGAVLAFLPTVVAMRRKMPNLNVIFTINLLLSWTGVGWLVAMLMALRNIPESVPAQA
jgi:hypothetical protein